MATSDSNDNEDKKFSRRDLLKLETECNQIEENPFEESIETDITRRDFLEKAKRYSSILWTIYSADTSLNILRQLKINEFETLDPRENHYHEKGVDKLLEEEKTSLNVYVFGDNSFGDVQIGASPEKDINRHANGLTDEGRFQTEINHVYDDEIEDLIEQAYVKQLDNSGDEKLDEIKDFLNEEFEQDQSDFNFLVGDFDTAIGEYKGTYIEGGYSAVCNVRTDKYVCNQVLHQLAHMAGAPQSVFMSAGDQMSWSPLKELRAHFDIVPYGLETKYNVQSNMENI